MLRLKVDFSVQQNSSRMSPSHSSSASLWPKFVKRSSHNWLDNRQQIVVCTMSLLSATSVRYGCQPTQTLNWMTLVIVEAYLSTQVPQPDWFIGAWTNQHLIVLREHQTGDRLSVALVRVQQLRLWLRLDTQLRLSFQVELEKGENAAQLDLRNFLNDCRWQTGKEMNFCSFFVLPSPFHASFIDIGSVSR